MIGSQSTKKMHATDRYSRVIAPGVWSDGAHLTLIETYRTLCRSRAPGAYNDLARATNAREIDILDADVSVQIARAYAQRPNWLEPPAPKVSASEGWIRAQLRSTLAEG